MVEGIFRPENSSTETPPMHDSKVRSRLKAQLTKFCTELCAGLSKPLGKFVAQMLYGIQSSQDVKLSNIGRALGEEIPLIRTEKRLSRNLKHAALEAELTRKLVEMASVRIQKDTVLALDLSDIRKEYARKMEHLATVWDGSTGETHPGYWLADVTGAEVHSSEIVPVCQKLFSTKAREFRSENAEILAVIDQANHPLNGRGIWTMDRGCDRKKLLEPLLDRGLRFVIRAVGDRMVRDRRGRMRSVAEVVAAAVDVQQDARQRPSFPPPAVHAPLARPGHQPGPLQCRLHPCVAQLDPMLRAQLLMEMAHIQVEVPLPVQPEHLFRLCQRHPLLARTTPPPIHQPVITVLLVPLPPAPHLPVADPDDLRCLPPADLPRHRPQNHFLHFHRPLHCGPRIRLHSHLHGDIFAAR